eukprot:CAMPEP_0114424752 /NCGR_PEP_ID=MMETSP0103-20121206/6860_1 /TAXON_ID=37642 ORGANISM="Paraphysomonas imperforata, Strain PA2" /NCGR_SAMPLE_ID=MMETSP0103 /ASSEMBLY_ACC=CAM_ASM_000201 /LENGTH=40 /DNA_ID= /DNA_START= /DNA_END= /DNA_ORIENTATION=
MTAPASTSVDSSTVTLDLVAGAELQISPKSMAIASSSSNL